MDDITTVAARIAAVEKEMEAFAAKVRTERDALIAEVKTHLDLHTAEADAAKALMARIQPAAPAGSPQVLLTKQASWISRNWRYLVLGLVGLIIVRYFTHGGSL